MTASAPSSDSDQATALARRARAGDESAFAALYRAHAGRVYALCLRLEGDAARARELTQDVFVRAWERLDGFRSESAFGTWLHRLAVNVVLGDRRSAWRRARRLVQAADPEVWERPGDAPNPGTALDLERAIDLLGDVASLRLESAGGAVTARGRFENVTATTVSGALTVSAPAVRHADLTSIAGGVTFDGSVAPGGTLYVTTHQAPVALVLPAAIAGDFELRSFDGLLVNRFAAEPGRITRGKPWRFRTGVDQVPRARIVVRSLKGDVTVFRR